MNCMEGLLLGLGTGATCLMSCGPVLIPFLLGERQGLGRSFRYVGQFLGGRLLAYLLIGAVVGAIGRSLTLGSSVWLGAVYCGLSVMMVAYGFHRFRQVCLGSVRRRMERRIRGSWPVLLPLGSGFLTSLNVCPPLLLAVSGASVSGGVGASVGMFGAFFVGTAVYFLPLPFVALLRRNQVLQVIGKYAAIVAGLLFFYKGIIIIINSL